MPMYDAPNGSTKYYIIERNGPGGSVAYLKTLGKTLLIGEDPDQSEAPTWSEGKYAFRFDTYTAACHWLLRLRPDGGIRVAYVDESTDDFIYADDGPIDKERFDERDWKEYHHMNGKHATSDWESS